MKRNWQLKLLLLFTLCFPLVFSSCDQKETTSPLRMCIDLRGMNSHKTSEVQGAFERFVENARSLGGPDNVLIEVIPHDGEERESTVMRLRTEILAGEGPDLFVITSDIDPSIFRFPQTAMKRNLLLPLNEFIDSAQFMEWDQLNQTVMMAGAFEGEQFLIPLDYSFSATLYRKDDLNREFSGDTTWRDVITDESNVLPASANYAFGTTLYDYDKFISGIFGDLADCSEESLLFSENDLLSGINDLIELNDRDYSNLPSRLRVNMGVLQNALNDKNDPNYFESFHSDDALSIVPMYQKNGGVTAIITHYAGISKNTKKPEQAFFLLDLLLSQETMQHSDVYRYMTDYLSLPVDNRLLSPDNPVFSWSLSEENYVEFCNVRNQITCARFDSVLEQYISDLFWRCYAVHKGQEDGNIEDLVHETYRIMNMEIAES